MLDWLPEHVCVSRVASALFLVGYVWAAVNTWRDHREIKRLRASVASASQPRSPQSPPPSTASSRLPGDSTADRPRRSARF